jgi:serine/threonine-protein phosphatase 2A regulatory subunit B
MVQQDNIIAAVPRKVYANAHAYHIHSISVNSDQETYISADDLRINLWNLNISDQSFSERPVCSSLFVLLNEEQQILSTSNQ